MKRGLLDWEEPMGGLLGGYSPSPDVVDRATFLPVGQYEDGSLTLAWPGFIKDAYEGAVRSYEQGRQLPRVDKEGYYAGTPRAEPLDAFNAASIAPIGAFGARAITNDVGDLGMFAGRGARTADQGKLAQAERMAADGAPREAIWNETGWFQGVDGKWRFEIDDSGQRLLKTQDELATLGRPIPSDMVFKHNALHEAYPKLGETPWYFTPELESGGGSFDPVRGIRIGSQSGFAHGKSGLGGMTLHEQQHAIQELEGFGRGGSRDFGLPKEAVQREAQRAYEIKLARDSAGIRTEDDEILEALGLASPKLTKPWNEMTPREQLEWYDAGRGRAYNALSGETEARAVQSRMNLTPEERASRPPWLDYDVPEKDQIVKFFSNPDNASLPALGLNGLDPSTQDILQKYGLLGP